MRRLRSFLFVFVIAQLLIPRPALAQPSISRPSLIEELNKEAASSGPEGTQLYSQHLIQLLIRVNIGDAPYTASLENRLAQAELAARNRKRKLISEADIAQAFNTLMKDTGGPNSLTADVPEVRRMRAVFESSSPALISRKENGDYCNPGEAVFLIGMLIENFGASPVTVSHSNLHDTGAAMEASSGPKSPARRRLENYFVGHSRSESVDVLNNLFHVFQI